MSKGYQQNYLTPGEYAALQDSGDKRLKYGMWNTGRLDEEKNRLRDIWYRNDQAQKAAKAKGIGGLFKVGGAVAGGVAGGLLGGPLGAMAGAGMGSEVAGAAGGMAGGDPGQSNVSGAMGSGAALLNAAKQPTATPPPDPNANLMLQDIGNPDAFQLKSDEEKARELWFAQRGGV